MGGDMAVPSTLLLLPTLSQTFKPDGAFAEIIEKNEQAKKFITTYLRIFREKGVPLEEMTSIDIE